VDWPGLLIFEFKSVIGTPTFNCPIQETEETSAPNKTRLECRVNDEKSTGKKNTTIEKNR
jgi:hypothetical protein